MGFREFFGFKAKSDAEFSSSILTLLPDGVPITTIDQRISQLFSGGGVVNRKTALSIPAVARGLGMLTALANLPLITYRGQNQVVRNDLLDQIDLELPNVVTMSRTIEDLVFDGCAYWQILLVNNKTGYPTKARHVPNELVTETEGRYWIQGEEVPDDEIIKFYSPRQPLLPAISQTVRQAVALASTSEMYANNPMPKLVFTPKEKADPDPEKTKAALDKFADARTESPFAYVGAALDVKTMDLLNPEELQLVEQNKQAMLAIANFFDMDPEEVGVSTTSRTYKNAVERRIDRRNDQLSWVALAIEQRLSLGDVTPKGNYVRFDYNEFFRADPLERAQIAQIDFQMGATTVDEYRESKGLAPLTPEQKAEVQVRQAPTQAIDATWDQLTKLNFSAEEDTGFSFESAEFSDLDKDKRTVKVLAVPYGDIARKNGRKFVFQKGSIKFDAANLKKIKLLRDHDYTQSVGYATAIEDTDDGLVVTFKIAPGPDGDRALAGFTDGSYDAASVGVDFDEDGLVTDRKNPGIYFVRSARLKEVSQVAIPAFENAGLISVEAASDNSLGVQMTDDTGAVNAPEKTYTLSELQALGVSFGKNDQAKPVEKETSVQADENVAPRELKANANKAVTVVTEPGPYRFDGTEGRFDFSSDLIAAGRNDGDARKRSLDFMSEDFAVSVSNASALNPTIQRPDLYVDEKYYDYPIWNTINKGTPPNGVNPFSWPKFSSAGTLVADHTEGVEPSLGTFVTTNATVTPTGVSGKVEINREAWDQGGNPQLSQLVRKQMHKAYAEALETASATFLDAQTLTDITLTTAAADSVLEGLLIDNLVALQITRGGYTMDNFLVHIDLYKALVKAKDADNRRLFPAITPVNATGQVTSKFAALDINGLIGRPAWALGASGSIAENSYLLDDEAVYGWATAPQDMTFDIQVKSVYVGLFGYKAFALRDTTGIRRFIYDPV